MEQGGDEHVPNFDDVLEYVLSQCDEEATTRPCCLSRPRRPLRLLLLLPLPPWRPLPSSVVTLWKDSCSKIMWDY